MRLGLLLFGVLVLAGLVGYNWFNVNLVAEGNQTEEIEQNQRNIALEQTELPDHEKTEEINVKFNKELGDWVAESLEILSSSVDDPKLQEANGDEGFEYYLKAKMVDNASENIDFRAYGLEEDHETMFSLISYIHHMQFVRTAHLGPNGEAKEAAEHADKWKPTDESMRKAYDYLYQLIHDLDVAINRNGEGETYGVTHLMNGERVSEIEDLLGGSM